jgi:hypothetical protein
MAGGVQQRGDEPVALARIVAEGENLFELVQVYCLIGLARDSHERPCTVTFEAEPPRLAAQNIEHHRLGCE